LGTNSVKTKQFIAQHFLLGLLVSPPHAGGNDRQPGRKKGVGEGEGRGQRGKPPVPPHPTTAPREGPLGLWVVPPRQDVGSPVGTRKKKRAPQKEAREETKGRRKRRPPHASPHLGRKKPPPLLIRATKPARSKKLKLFFSGGFARSLSPLQCREKRDVSVKGSWRHRGRQKPGAPRHSKHHPLQIERASGAWVSEVPDGRCTSMPAVWTWRSGSKATRRM